MVVRDVGLLRFLPFGNDQLTYWGSIARMAETGVVACCNFY